MYHFFLLFLQGLKRKPLYLFHKYQQFSEKLFIFLLKHINATNQQQQLFKLKMQDKKEPAKLLGSNNKCVF